MKAFLLSFLLLLGHLASSQLAGSTKLAGKIVTLQNLLARAGSLNPFDNNDEISAVNDSIKTLALTVFSSPFITRYKIDSLFPGIVHSKDKLLWIFDWFENTGGTFQSYLSVLHYRTASNKPKAVYISNNYYDQVLFTSECGYVTGIHKLPHASKNIYLCLFSVKGCSSCCADVAAVVELTKDSINLRYPGFVSLEIGEKGRFYKAYWPIHTLESRCGSMQKFDFDPKTSTISFEYKTDDMTAVSPEETNKVKGKLRWNGKIFVETIVKQ